MNNIITNAINFTTYDFKDKQKNVNNYITRMFNRTAQTFQYEGLPDSIPVNVLEYYLQAIGTAVITEHGGNLVVLTGNAGGICDEYYRPKEFIVANPWLNLSKNLKIGEECILIYNDSMYQGLGDMYQRYATLLVENDLTIKIADIMARCTAILSAGTDDRTKASAELFIKRLEDGDISVITDNAIIETLKTLPYTDSAKSSITDLIELQQYLKASWFNEMGMNANYNMKRESLNSAEAQMNEDGLMPLIDDMLHCRKKWVDEVNAKYGTNITVKYHSPIKKEYEKNDEITEDTEKSEDALITEGDLLTRLAAIEIPQTGKSEEAKEAEEGDNPDRDIKDDKDGNDNE